MNVHDGTGETEMKLYASATSPYARKARALILEKGIDCQWVLESPGETEARFMALNPLAKVPVLETDAGEAIYDSPVIVEYLDSLDDAPLIPASGAARWQVLRMQALCDGVMDATVARYLENMRKPERRSAVLLEKQADKLKRALEVFADGIENREYMIGKRFGLGDIALISALDYMSLRDEIDWRAEYPALGIWADNMGARPCLKETAPPTS